MAMTKSTIDRFSWLDSFDCCKKWVTDIHRCYSVNLLIFNCSQQLTRHRTWLMNFEASCHTWTSAWSKSLDVGSPCCSPLSHTADATVSRWTSSWYHSGWSQPPPSCTWVGLPFLIYWDTFITVYKRKITDHCSLYGTVPQSHPLSSNS